MNLTRDEQIAELKRMGSGKLMQLARPGVVMLAAGLVLAGAITGNPVFYGIALFFAIIAFAIWQITPHISNAARGVSEGIKQNGTVEINIQQEADVDLYHGLIFMDNQPLWQMDFAQPQGWQPAEGKYQVELAFIRGVEWPVVVFINDSLLYPSSKPKLATTKSRI